MRKNIKALVAAAAFATVSMASAQEFKKENFNYSAYAKGAFSEAVTWPAGPDRGCCAAWRHPSRRRLRVDYRLMALSFTFNALEGIFCHFPLSEPS